MPRDFNIDINKSLQNTEPIENNPKLQDDTLNDMIRVADEIIEIFDKRKINLEDAYYILCSLADSIYMIGIRGLITPSIWLYVIQIKLYSLSSLSGILSVIFRIGAIIVGYEQSRIV